MPDPTQSHQTNKPDDVTSTSRSLLMRARGHDPEAWNRLVLLYEPLIRFWCRKQGVPEQDLPDVTQEVFQSVADHLDSFRRDRPGDTFRGWLRAISRTRAIDHFRKQQRQPVSAGGSVAQARMGEVEDPVDDESVEEPVYHQIFLTALEQIRHEFKDTTWKAFWRVVVDGETPRDAGEELGMRPGTIRVAKSRVLQRLRRELGELPEFDKLSEQPPGSS